MNKTQQVIDLKKQGMAHRAIAKAVGLKSAGSVHAILAKHYYPYLDTHKGPKICFFDIETSPIKAYVWGLFKQNIQIDRIVDDWEVLTWAAKYAHEDGVHYATQAKDTEEQVVAKLWNVLDDSDIVVAQNGVRFDVKKMNAKFLEFGLGEPSPYKVIDTLHIAKNRFAFTSNKLDYMAKFLGGEGKMEHEGFMLWRKFMDGDKDAQQRMLDYNIRDVYELEEVYYHLRAWNRKAPNISLHYDDGVDRCNVCASKHINVVDGKHAYTNLSKFQLFQCGNCGAYSRGRKNLAKRDKLRMNVT